MGGGNNGKKYMSVKDTMLELMKIKEMTEISEYRRKMNFPAESTSSINIGSGSGGEQPTNEETTTSNKGKSYNRNSKRGTRLVSSSNNG